jgi:hypothetical protein
MQDYNRRLMLELDAAGAPTKNEDGVELLTPEARIEAMGRARCGSTSCPYCHEKHARLTSCWRGECATVENGLLPAPRKTRMAKR